MRRIKGFRASGSGDMGVSKNRGAQYSTLNSRILIIRTPKIRYHSVPPFSETPILCQEVGVPRLWVLLTAQPLRALLHLAKLSKIPSNPTSPNPNPLKPKALGFCWRVRTGTSSEVSLSPARTPICGESQGSFLQVDSWVLRF